MTGSDEARKSITVNSYEGWRDRILSFALGLHITGYIHKDDVEKDIFDYLKLCNKAFTHDMGQEVNVLKRVDITVRKRMDQDLRDDLQLTWIEALRKRATGDNGKTFFQSVLSREYTAETVTIMAAQRSNALASGGGGKANGKGNKGGNRLNVDGRMYNDNKLRNIVRAHQRSTQNNGGAPSTPFPPNLPLPPPMTPPPVDAGKGKGGRKGKGKGGRGGQRRGAGEQPGVPFKKAKLQANMPNREHDAILVYLKKPGNEGVCKHYQSSKGCSFGSECRFKHRCCHCGKSGHGLTTCHAAGVARER